MEIIKNAIKCKKCGDEIESKTVHDFRFCKCGSVAVDGGHDYLRRCGNREDWEEMSVTREVLIRICKYLWVKKKGEEYVRYN